MMNPFLQVAIGGALGATGRFAVYRMIPSHWAALGLATGLVNIVGSFLMGLLAAAFAHRFGNTYAPLLLTGFLGGFTTFSA
ncbi:MAG: CrcB family protein, partial [Paracoccus sp. (in: a-proteobacteria)]|nr:CrcB family protein [Paracoccus sp. (in: a-proteobacteria)]